jgi:hypothetical protein
MGHPAGLVGQQLLRLGIAPHKRPCRHRSVQFTHDRPRAFRGQTRCDASIVHDSGMEAAHMRKRNRRPPCRKIVLKLPDLDHAKSAVLNSLALLIREETISLRWSSSSAGIAPSRDWL